MRTNGRGHEYGRTCPGILLLARAMTMSGDVYCGASGIVVTGRGALPRWRSARLRAYSIQLRVIRREHMQSDGVELEERFSSVSFNVNKVWLRL